MNNVKFQFTDAFFLFCIPERGCDLRGLLEMYTFFERTGAPDYETLAGCLGRAVLAGAMPVPTGGRYVLTPEWFARVHQWDGQISPSELACLEFAEEVQDQEWPAVGPEFVLPTPEYERAIGRWLHQGRLFAG